MEQQIFHTKQFAELFRYFLLVELISYFVGNYKIVQKKVAEFIVPDLTGFDVRIFLCKESWNDFFKAHSYFFFSRKTTTVKCHYRNFHFFTEFKECL